jgi:uncharacterized protein YdhG (YjbR/CyaY superfamily)
MKAPVRAREQWTAVVVVPGATQVVWRGLPMAAIRVQIYPCPRKLTTVDAYVAALPDGVQQIFEALRHSIRKLAPHADKAMRYDMAAWRVKHITVIHAAAWKHHIGLYPVYRGDEDFEMVIGPYRDKKDTVKLLYEQPMPFDVIERIITARLAALETRP